MDVLEETQGEEAEELDDDALDKKLLLRVSRKIGKDWKWLGRNLSFDDETLSAIEENHKQDDVSEMAYWMLTSWQKNSPMEATITNLVVGLRNLDLHHIAEFVLFISNRKPNMESQHQKSPSALPSASTGAISRLTSYPKACGSETSFSQPSTSQETQSAAKASYSSLDFSPSGRNNTFQMGDSKAPLFVNYGSGSITAVLPPPQPDPEDIKQRAKINKILTSFHTPGGRKAYSVDNSILMQVRQSLGKSWRDLGLEMGFDKPMLDTIEEENFSSGRKEMAYQTLVKWWKRESGEAKVNILAEHLANIRKYDIAQQILGMSAKEDEEHIISEKHERLSRSSAGIFQRFDIFGKMRRRSLLLSKIQNKLKDQYQKVRLKGLPWIKDIKITLEHCYVELSLVPQSDNGMDLPEEIVQLTHLFNLPGIDKQLSRILVEGGAGFGKTTFGYKLCYDYAKQQNYMSKFDLVFMLPLRYYSGGLNNLLIQSTRTCEEDVNDLFAIIKKKSTRTLMILDGFDELPKQHAQSLLPLLRSEIFPHVTVIVTSRPGLFTSEISEDTTCDISPDICIAENHFGRRIKIIGIHKNLVPVFIEKHLSILTLDEQHSVLDQLTKMIQKEMLTSSFVQCPLFLLMIISLLTETETTGSQNLQTRTELYKEVLNFVIRRYLSKIGDSIAHPVDLYSFEYAKRPFYVNLIIQFGQFSFEAIKAQQLAFSINEILGSDTNRDARIIDIGLLTNSVIAKGFQDQVYFEPVHKSLLEFAAAYWLWVEFMNGSRDQWEKNVALLRPQKDSAPYSLLFPFLAGMLGSGAPALFQALMQYTVEYNNWFGSLAFSLSEIEISLPVFSSLRPFLSHEWRIAWYKINILSFTISSQHEKFLSLAIRDGKINEIRWFLEDVALLPDEVNVTNLILDFRNSFSSLTSSQNCNINCRNLHCILSSSNPSLNEWQNFLTMISCICYKLIFFHCLCPNPRFLHWLCAALSTGLMKDIKVEFIRCSLTNHDTSTAEELVHLVQKERVSGIFLELTTSPNDIPTTSSDDQCTKLNTLLQQQIDNLVLCASKSSSMQHFSLFNGQKSTPVINLTKLCNSGQKSWQWIRLRNVDLKFSDEIRNHNCYIQHLQITDCIFPHSMSNLLQSFRVVSLFCNYPFLAHNVDVCLLQDSLTEVHVELDESIFYEGFFFRLTQLSNLQILSIQVSSFNYRSFPVTVKTWVMSACNSGLYLKMLVVRCVERNLHLASEVVKCVIQCLDGNLINSSSPQARTSSCSVIPQLNKFHFQNLTISTDMAPKYNNLSESNAERIIQFCCLVAEIKQPLVNKQLPVLDIVMLASADFFRCMSIFKLGDFTSLFDIFSTEMGFVVRHDRWGMRENDSMWSKLYYNVTPFMYDRFSVTHQGDKKV